MIGLSADKEFLTCGGRKMHKVIKLVKENGRYSKFTEVVKIYSRTRNSLEYGVFDVKWSPRK